MEKISKRHIVVLKYIRDQVKAKGPAYLLIKKILTSIDSNCRKKLFENFLINFAWFGNMHRKKLMEEQNIHIPKFFVLSVTSKCNFHCRGCWAGEYAEHELTTSEIDNILTQAKELGMYFATISGGEPFLRKDLLELFRKHNDMYFLVYTNGSLITEETAKELKELGNIAPAISIEGFEEETDKRRGTGSFKNAIKVMELLKKHELLYGFSATHTRHNTDTITQERFIDMMIDKGCSFCWYFQYIPIGREPNINLMPTPEQRNKLRQSIKEFRKIKAIFIGDFWNDGPYVNGCMAGGKRYIHINAEGNVEPCVFTHFSVDNIKNKPLKDCINSPFFNAIRKQQPFSSNYLTPCMVIDHPKQLRKFCKEFNAKPTHPGAESIIQDKEVTKHLDKYSKEYKKIAREPWEKEWVPRFKSGRLQR